MSDMAAEWVKARYSGEQAKITIGMADAGIGYYILERPESGSGWVVCAFLRPKDKPLPEHLSPILNERLIAKLDAWRASH